MTGRRVHRVVQRGIENGSCYNFFAAMTNDARRETPVPMPGASPAAAGRIS